MLGKVLAVVFSVASIAGFLLWLGTTYRTPIDTQKVMRIRRSTKSATWAF